MFGGVHFADESIYKRAQQLANAIGNAKYCGR
jgi:hypothetical protein